MNINELVNKHGVMTGIYDCLTDPYDKLRNGDQHSSVIPDLERFAALIVQECATIAQESTELVDIGLMPYTSVNVEQRVLEHFGLSEE